MQETTNSLLKSFFAWKFRSGSPGTRFFWKKSRSGSFETVFWPEFSIRIVSKDFCRLCLIEPFHATPSISEVLDCVSKQLGLRGMLRRESARQQAYAAAWPGEQVPRLWILSAGRPERAMRAFDMALMDGWPAGFWQVAPSIWDVHLVVLRDLPETRDTLLLRLLGRDRTFQRAMHELFALPENAWERALAIPQLVVAYRIESPRIPGRVT